MRKTVVLNVVGLTPALLGDATPNLSALARAGTLRPLATVVPAVTCTVQSSFVTGALPREHGCVANGWYFRDLAEVLLWRQHHALVGGEKLWQGARRVGLVHRRQVGAAVGALVGAFQVLRTAQGTEGGHGRLLRRKLESAKHEIRNKFKGPKGK